jgi:Flp pilus assembly protein TadG
MRSLGKFFGDVSRLGRELGGDESGSPAVEFALVFPIFIGVVLATLQAGTIFLAKAYFESGAEAAARVVLTNQTGSLTVAQFKTEICNQLTALFDCGQVTVELEPRRARQISRLCSRHSTHMETWLALRRLMSAPTPAPPARTCCW